MIQDVQETKKTPHGPVSVIELARLLGVSHATVSFVLNGKAKKYKISDATAERVMAAAKKHNCIPNHHARNLRSRKSGVLGVLVTRLTMDWAETLMQGIQQVIDDTEYVPFIATHQFDTERNRKELRSALERRDEGLVVFPLPDCEDLYHSISSAGVPLVLIGEELPGLESISSVVWDSEKAAAAAVQHLVDLGRKRIAFLGIDYPGLGTLHRFKAYCQTLKNNGLELRQEWISRISVTRRDDHVTRVVNNWFTGDPQDAPDAVFALNDVLGLSLMTELTVRGMSVPEDVAVIGLGDLPLSRYPAIGLSTVAEPIKAMGVEAARLILDLISGKADLPQRRVLQSAEVIARSSTIGAKWQIPRTGLGVL